MTIVHDMLKTYKGKKGTTLKSIIIRPIQELVVSLREEVHHEPAQRQRHSQEGSSHSKQEDRGILILK